MLNNKASWEPVAYKYMYDIITTNSDFMYAELTQKVKANTIARQTEAKLGHIDNYY